MLLKIDFHVIRDMFLGLIYHQVSCMIFLTCHHIGFHKPPLETKQNLSSTVVFTWCWKFMAYLLTTPSLT